MSKCVCRIYRINLGMREAMSCGDRLVSEGNLASEGRNFRRRYRNSGMFSNMEISRIGYEFLPMAAEDFMVTCLERPAAETDFEIGREEFGKPYFLHFPDIEFNISNSGDWILMALSTEKVGIDIQEITDIPLDKVAKRVFPPDEYETFMKMDDQRDFFFREWVLRESYVKWTGEGLIRDMRTLPHDAWQAVLPAFDGYKAAITAARPLSCENVEVQYDRQKGFIWTK